MWSIMNDAKFFLYKIRWGKIKSELREYFWKEPRPRTYNYMRLVELVEANIYVFFEDG